MKFNYQYRTKDNKLHSGSINAMDREAAYLRLKKIGIRPSRLVEAPGVYNKISGKGKRWFLIFLLSIVASFFALRFAQESNKNQIANSFNTRSPRHQIYGDPVIMKAINNGDTSSFLKFEGDRILAWFAQPARICAPAKINKNKSYRNLLNEKSVKSLNEALKIDVPILKNEPREIHELKQIINGMKDELRAYLSNGNGTIQSYYRRLNERLDAETRIYNTVKSDLQSENDPSVWEEKNEGLRKLGIRTIPMPSEYDNIDNAN